MVEPFDKRINNESRFKINPMFENQTINKQRLSDNEFSSSTDLEKQKSNQSKNMALELVLSADSIIKEKENNNCLTTSSSNVSLSSNLIKSRDRSQLGSGDEIPNCKSEREDCSIYGNEVNGARIGMDNEDILQSPELKNYTTCHGKSSEKNIVFNEQGVKSIKEDKQHMFKKHLTITLSCIYAVFIVTLGLVIYISDIIIGYSAFAEMFSIYLLIIGFVYMVYLIVDIRKYVNKIKENSNENKIDWINIHNFQNTEGSKDDHCFSLQLPSWENNAKNEELHMYCFNRGRHSGSFYLKLGAAGFCLGHLIHSGLLLGYQIVFLTSDGNSFYECASIATLILDITYPIYSFLLLYFIFKYSNVIINSKLELGRLALMHCIATSLCFWIWTIIRETNDSLTHSKNNNHEDEHSSSSEEKSEENLLNLTFPKIIIQPKIGTICTGDSRLDVIYKIYSPYLYPFTVEYNILVVGVLFIIWQNIGKCQKLQENSDGKIKHCPAPGMNEENGFTSNFVINVDCHSTNTGLFCGIIVIVFAIISIILFFVAISNREYVHLGLLINSTTDLIFMVLMTISAIFAYKKVTTLDVNYHQVSLLDDLLLFICIPAFFLNAIFSIIPAFHHKVWVNFANIILQVIQILIQTPLIIEGLRRCSNSKSLRLKKPGRSLITFLVICNVAMWITETFEIKSNTLVKDARYDFYGKVWWTVIGHVTLPLIMFYRFHSSVCLADIWKSAYVPEELH